MTSDQTWLPFAERDARQATIICDDVLAWAEKTPPIGAHALLADAPYELNFMGRNWDRSGIAFRPDTWKALAQHLLHGAFGMCFASSRGWHRLACAIEDAGLIIHPSIFGWVNGAGFPKATRIDTQIDAAAGVDRQVKPWAGHTQNTGIYGKGKCNDQCPICHRWRFDHNPCRCPRDNGPQTTLAQAWAGHRYGLQALKPALEPIIVWQKPYQGKPVQSITQTGAGALWIDGGRIDSAPRNPGFVAPSPGGRAMMATGNEKKVGYESPGKRWPANFALCHTEQCVRVGARQVKGTNRSNDRRGTMVNGYISSQHTPDYTDATGHETVAEYRCADNCPVQSLDQQAGERKAGVAVNRHRAPEIPNQIYGKGWKHSGRDEGYGDHGHASRFFFTADYSLDVAERLAQADPVFYSAKASRRERDAGLEGMPLEVAGVMQDDGYRWEFDGKGNKINLHTQRRNTHPTVKPLKLCQWLATLLLPPAAYAPRRLLNVFSGSGSEGIGAILAGWDEVVMIDSDQGYVDIARQRVAYWQHRGRP